MTLELRVELDVAYDESDFAAALRRLLAGDPEIRITKLDVSTAGNSAFDWPIVVFEGSASSIIKMLHRYAADEMDIVSEILNDIEVVTPPS